MKKEVVTCDIEDMSHSGLVESLLLDVIFDHDQEDGKSKTEPYFEHITVDMCKNCRDYMMKNKRYIYAYGAMGYNKFYLK